ncbi:MAG: methyltransferase domain-containing protein [Treponema sp.]|nr:methyltransferase domain-containing protein [Treponema sp.]
MGNDASGYLLIPARAEGRGGGHRVRSEALLRALREKGADAWMLDASVLKEDNSAGAIGREEAFSRRWKLVIADNFRTTSDEVKAWRKLGPLLGIDEGLSRDGFDFLIDLLPPLPGRQRANITDLCLNPLPNTVRENRSFARKKNGAEGGTDGLPRVLVTFGAEDAAALTLPAAAALRQMPVEVSAALGPLRKNNAEDRRVLTEAGVAVLEESAAYNLREKLAAYDLIITHFGLTAFEALYAGVPAAVVSPTKYHETLAAYAGFPSFYRYSKVWFNTPELAPARKRKKFEAIYSEIAEASAQTALRWGLNGPRRDLAELTLGFEPLIYRACPVCGAENIDRHPCLARFPRRSYRRCSCGTIYMERLNAPPLEYDRDYFFASYRKQYGKTYLEDFSNIRQNAAPRLSRIKAALRRNFAAPRAQTIQKPRLLDIGCAYGPFLAAAADAGFDVMGLDPSEDAVRYVREVLRLPVIHGFFPPAGEPLSGESFDVITAWFVIEHLIRPDLALRAVNRLLKPGGILALATPSPAGVSARKSLSSFLEQSPSDHWTLWDPRFCGSILKRFGFVPVRVFSIGHHPERFPLVGGLAAAFRPFALAAGGISRLFGLGDSFEMYALKTGEGAW